ncbi:MAG: ExbD/TolR family protein [Nitrospinota bacterium]
MNHPKRINRTLSEINVTPFVDVMLVLLIIFMVTTPLLEKEIEVDLPKAEAKDVEKRPTGVITFKKNKRIYFNGKRIQISELEKFLRKSYLGRYDEEVYLKGDQALPYGEIVKVMAIIKKAGIEKLGMITDQLEE